MAEPPLLTKKNEKEYLRIMKSIAEEAGYNADDLTLAHDGVHKLSLVVGGEGGKAPDDIKFGNIDYPDFILFIMSGDKEEANKHRKNYLTRSAGMKGDWKKNPFSRNNLSRRIIWFEGG